MTDRLPPRDVAENFALCFQGQANHLAMQFGGPLYLVGSLLTSHEPGDIDLRLQLERADLEALFGENLDCGAQWTPGAYQRAREELKQSRRLTRRWCAPRRPKGWGPRMDFQFQITLFSDLDGLPIMKEGFPYLRLDDIPLSYFTAGKTDP